MIPFYKAHSNQRIKLYHIVGGGFKHFFIFTPTRGRFPIWLYNIFQRGWNHQLVYIISQVTPSWSFFETETSCPGGNTRHEDFLGFQVDDLNGSLEQKLPKLTVGWMV